MVGRAAWGSGIFVVDVEVVCVGLDGRGCLMVGSAPAVPWACADSGTSPITGSFVVVEIVVPCSFPVTSSL